MQAGIYSVEFQSDGNLGMGGLLVIEDGKIHGGDLTYLYRGTYESNGSSDSLTAKLKVSHYRGPANSVVGPLREFNLTLNLQSSGAEFQAQGSVDEAPGSTLLAKGVKCADLVA